MAKTRKKMTGYMVFVSISVVLFSLFCVLPFLLVVSASFTSEEALRYGIHFFPKRFSAESYKYIFYFPGKVLRAYGVSCFITVVGTLLNMALMVSCAFALSKKEFTYNRVLTFVLFFTVMFSGGMVPSYIMIKRFLHMYDTIWVLIIPWLITPGNIILLRVFFRSVPETLYESASLEGASEYAQLVRIGLPLIKSGIATIAFFSVLQYWNDSYTAIIYTENPDLVPIQVFLTQMTSYLQYIKQNGNVMGTIDVADLPSQSILYGMCVVASAPLLLVFSFLQKYFVRGLTAGSVKG